MSRVGVGLVGCGNVSGKYLDTIANDGGLRFVACADADVAAARNLAKRFGFQAVNSVDDLLGDDRVDLVLNLTPPSAHFRVSIRALEAGKHIYTEKPLATSVQEAQRIIELARSRKLSVGCAPDTFLGDGLRAVQRLIDNGSIGRPLLALCSVLSLGPEIFHPNPEFLYQLGAGPVMDVGPYIVTALTALLGRVTSVTARTSNLDPQRTLLVGERSGQSICSDIPTTMAALLEFKNGTIASVVQSWDVAGTLSPGLEIHGTEGSISAARPDSWAGPVSIKRRGENEFSLVLAAPTGAAAKPRLGIGVLEMVAALRSGDEPSPSGSRGLHTLEVLTAVEQSGRTGSTVQIGGKE